MMELFPKRKRLISGCCTFATTIKDRRHGMLCVGGFLLLFRSDYAFYLKAVCHQAQQVITAGCYVCFPVLQGPAGYPKIIAKFYLRHACGNPQGFDGGLLYICHSVSLIPNIFIAIALPFVFHIGDDFVIILAVYDAFSRLFACYSFCIKRDFGGRLQNLATKSSV